MSWRATKLRRESSSRTTPKARCKACPHVTTSFEFSTGTNRVPLPPCATLEACLFPVGRIHVNRSKPEVPSSMRNARTEFSCAICGAGPAGMGFLFHAFKTGKLADIARKGLLIIDKRFCLGSGKLGDYANVVGNSIGKTFLACLEHENFESVFGAIRDYSPLHKQIVEAADSAPRLSDAGDLLALATERLIAHLVSLYGVKVLRGCEIDTIRRLEGGRFNISYHDVRKPEVHHVVTSGTIVMNLGGTQHVEEIDELCSGLGVPAPGAGVRTYASDDLLSLNSAQLFDKFARYFTQSTARRTNRITIIGGSHSAFTMVDRLAVELGGVGLDEIAVIHRSPIRLFFETVDEARANGYAVDEANDVCPVTKRVNRSSGLRYRAFEVARSIMSNGRVPGTRPHVELIEPGSSDAARARAGECLGRSIVVIHSAGYGPNTSVLTDHQGVPIPLQLGQGGLICDTFGRPFDMDGDAVRGLFTFGLGSGFTPGAQLGSEAAFRGRIYGVWIFHHDIGGKVLKGVLEELALIANESAPESTPARYERCVTRLRYM